MWFADFWAKFNDFLTIVLLLPQTALKRSELLNAFKVPYRRFLNARDIRYC